MYVHTYIPTHTHACMDARAHTLEPEHKADGPRTNNIRQPVPVETFLHLICAATDCTVMLSCSTVVMRGRDSTQPQ